MSGRSENYYAPNRGRLFRAAEHHGGYFGRGSYWTTQYDHARRFAGWAEHEQTVFARSELVIWTVEIDVPEERVVDLIGPAFFLISSTRINAAVPRYAEDGYRWLFFREPPAFDGVIWTQGVYLGAEPLHPDLVTSDRADNVLTSRPANTSVEAEENERHRL